MKIGLLHYSMPPVVGGVERVLAAHARLFREDGHEVVLLCDGRQKDDGTYLAVPGFTNTGDYTENRDAFVHFILQLKLDVVMVHNVLTMPFCPVATDACHVLAGTDLKVISWVHDLAATNPYYLVPADDLIRKYPAGARVVAISEERADSYRKVTDYANVTVVPNGVDALGELGGEFVEQRPELRMQLRGAFPILFHPTRILRRKNIGLGIQVTEELKKIGLHPRLLISGAPEPFSGDQASYRQKLDNQISQLGLTSEVLFLGDDSPLDGSDIDQLYHLANALFFPSEEEGFGLPILEAGLRRVPIFCSETQPLSALARRYGSVFSLNSSPIQIAAQMARFLAIDAGSQVRMTVQRDFDWQGIYEKHILPLLS